MNLKYAPLKGMPTETGVYHSVLRLGMYPSGQSDLVGSCDLREGLEFGTSLRVLWILHSKLAC